MKTKTVTDIDGNTYNTVTIGTQVWMKENLKVTHYRNGDAIENIDSPDVGRYGRLYDARAVNDKRGLAPEGWHVPSDAEWTTLTDYLGGKYVAGGKLKEKGITHWTNPNTGATNRSGFTALPGGYRGNDGSFNYISYYGHWWAATACGATSAWLRGLGYSNTTVDRYGYYKTVGFSVRCVKD